MQEIIFGENIVGEDEILIRKSKRILFFAIFRAIFILFFIIILIYFIWNLSGFYGFDKQLNDIIGLLILILIIYFFGLFIVWIIRYFYDIIICSNNKIWSIKLGLFSTDNVDVIELYRVQEMCIEMDGFIRIVFNVGDITIIEQNDMKRIIYRIDNPKIVLIAIQALKDKHIKTRNINK